MKELKAYLSSLPLLSKVEPRECLLVYPVVSEVAVSAVMVREDKGTQSPIYYIRKTLVDAGTRVWTGTCARSLDMRSDLLVYKDDMLPDDEEEAKKLQMQSARILSMPYHPAGNGQAKSSNKSILNIMKKKLESANRLWPELLPEVLWAYRTMPKMSTGETPYSLVYGADAVIPVKVGEPNLRYSYESSPRNDESRRQELDEAEE
uniref:Uncharacterized protein LOC104235011 n=1 Tax=Nicotiana sylvestris TaxID=4096 RepID=A0A1U7X4F9_NICSY|nr:PREDICTED: uncharacterized protein LOC104235011 [Nicotiana sylvestris]